MKIAMELGMLEVELAGAPLGPVDANRLAGVTVHQRLAMPAQLELVFQGVGPEFAGRAALLVGLSAGVRSEPAGAELFAGDITAVEHVHTADGGLEVRVRAYDRLHRLRKRQSVRDFADLTIADLARRLVERDGLPVEAREEGPRRSRVVQWRQSDLALLADLAGAAGLYFTLACGRLELFTLAGTGQPVVLRLGSELLEAVLELNGDDPVDEVTALGWDPTTGRRFEETAAEVRSGRTAAARVPGGELTDAPVRTLPNLAARDAEPVRAAARAGLDRAAGRAVTARGIAQGHAGIRPGAKVRLDGVAATFAGEYVVTEAVHTFDTERGYLTRFGSEPPPPIMPAALPAVAPGLVERVDDPEGFGRVTVALPTLPSVTTDWLRVLLPAVGSGKGFIALPAPGDEVLVLFPGGDPAAGIVLGGLATADDPSDFGVENDRVSRYVWRTRHGETVELDEGRERIQLRTPNGSAVTIGSDRLSIVAATDLELAAPGRTITIRAKAVDFERAES